MIEQKNHKVFEFAFEDTPELMIDKYYKATIIRHWEIAKKTETIITTGRAGGMH